MNKNMEYIKIIAILVSIIIIGFLIYKQFKSNSDNGTEQKVEKIVKKTDTLNVLDKNNINSDYYNQLVKLKNMYQINLNKSTTKSEKEKIKNIFLNSDVYKNTNKVLNESDKTIEDINKIKSLNSINLNEKKQLQKPYDTLKNNNYLINKGINDVLDILN